MGTRYDLSFCACKTACLASELPVSMGPRPHLWILIAKQCLLVENYKTLWVPDLTCHFVHAKHREWHSLCGSQTSPAILCLQNSVRSIRITCLYGSQPSPVVFGSKTVTFGSRTTILSMSQTSPVILCMQNIVISTRITSLCGSKTSPVILCVQNSVPSIRITSLYGSQPSSAVFGFRTATFGPE